MMVPPPDMAALFKWVGSFVRLGANEPYSRLGKAMKIRSLLLLFALPLPGVAGLNDNPPDARNSIPISMEICFVSIEGHDFRLSREERFSMDKDRICRLRSVTSYTINGAFDESAREVELEVSEPDWIEFRKALRAAGLELMKKASDESAPIKSFGWFVRIEYPDTKLEVEAIDSPNPNEHFAKLRDAIFNLTKGKWPNSEPMPLKRNGSS